MFVEGGKKGDYAPELMNITCGIPQGSILFVLFNIYKFPLAQIIEHYNISRENYADDTQLYISVSVNDRSLLYLLSEYRN